ncbi:MAG: hypothetical protein H6Q72_943 [Firmicutes bacterium]|nr:hypothetical protein [Bacillota bacterium]
MKLDAKHQVLMAVYTEYQKDNPDMPKALLKPKENLGIESDAFITALKKLYSEGYITNPGISGSGSDTCVSVAIMGKMMVTREGLEYVESMLNIDKTLSEKEKVNIIHKTFTEQGLDILTDFAAKVTAEIIKSKI